jgi:hypothetical protein
MQVKLCVRRHTSDPAPADSYFDTQMQAIQDQVAGDTGMHMVTSNH